LAHAPGLPISVPYLPGGVVLGDVNDDNKPDLIVRSAESPNISVPLGFGDDQFLVAQSSQIQLQDYASEIVPGDINSDGWKDLVLDSHNSYKVELLLGDGIGNFHPAPNQSFQ
jgi:hypothetical protein